MKNIINLKASLCPLLPQYVPMLIINLESTSYDFVYVIDKIIFFMIIEKQ